jgi:1-deoxy-D-xylulose-5-phosphate reductoisomerase
VASSPLTFQEIDHAAFPLFGLGFEAGRRGGCGPAVYNAGNEIAVQAFLDGKVRFPEMAEVVHEAMEQLGADAARDVRDVFEADAEARSVAVEAVRRLAEARTGATS